MFWNIQFFWLSAKKWKIKSISQDDILQTFSMAIGFL